jgi:hypothetical protein
VCATNYMLISDYLSALGFGLFVIAILTRLRWYLIAILLCIFQMNNDIEHFSYILWSFAFLISVLKWFQKLKYCPSRY